MRRHDGRTAATAKSPKTGRSARLRPVRRRSRAGQLLVSTGAVGVTPDRARRLLFGDELPYPQA
ncbi:hypothetical protein LI99_09730 [Mycolicibacterium smegmatis]|uniref:Uncharacterized protein n=2 Tax=Mycolicibacterium smegmatis (strain ATCC 700084 / mc(2)155) TaxID=246196 RepID=I7FHY3_MYCS2|nr:hypothetical protein MSMEG_1948 [Mycolicibacterium smegmatis MC2 155]AIU13793.1 hypothetical protein LI99_09730 [Mycolicibacterium smegmatis]AFP38378.1 hypothetical protein MSMEI_1906 [Mycolicibacterium smegmatis MC2 155]AIU07168.1 hypothetical protein LJ00_09730 [Mycolicibacterium smegmatis MC2 155]AIU20417.1 hypothetical protein LI98_09730 [Mycolicibacterium smegmatis]